MRVFIRLAVVALTFAGVACAQSACLAADAPVQAIRGPAMFATRAVPYEVFDYGPGIYMRAYWATPWNGRHYFPATGKKPRVGRRENLNERGHYRPAKSFYREWSTSQLIEVVPLPPPPQRQPPISK